MGSDRRARYTPGRRFWRALTIALAVAELAVAASVWAQGGQKRVLVLYSTRRDAQIVLVGERELPRILDAGVTEGVDYYSEYIDRSRFPDPGYQEAFTSFIRLKYKDLHFDAVVTIQDVALQFVRSRAELFQNSPVVFFANDPGLERHPNSTGLVTAVNLDDTLRFATTLQPDVRNVFVVVGAAQQDRPYEAMARAQFQPFESRLAITYLSGLPTAELRTRLAALPAHSIVYYVLVNQDGAGEVVHPLEYLDRIVASSSAPVYSWVDSTMGRGIVGGSLKKQAVEMDAIGGLVLRVLKGERADAIPVTSPDLNVNEVDFRQLRRWGITETRLPADTAVLYREATAWQRYRGYILAAVAVVLAQTALIAGLLVQRARRRRAESEVRASRAALQDSYDRIRDLGGRLLTAQDEERARIARELHDDINQQVALLSIDLGLLRESPSQKAADEAMMRTETLAKSVHDLSHRLHPAKLRLIGLVAALKGLQHELAAHGTTVTFTHEHVPPALPPEITMCLFRVAQEAVQNAFKYSGARDVAITLTGTPGALLLSVVDRGIGFDVREAWGRGLGLISMTERLEAVGGVLDIQSRPGGGTVLRASVPLEGAFRADSA